MLYLTKIPLAPAPVLESVWTSPLTYLIIGIGLLVILTGVKLEKLLGGWDIAVVGFGICILLAALPLGFGQPYNNYVENSKAYAQSLKDDIEVVYGIEITQDSNLTQRAAGYAGGKEYTDDKATISYTHHGKSYSNNIRITLTEDTQGDRHLEMHTLTGAGGKAVPFQPGK